MTLFTYLFLMGFSSVVSWAAWILVVTHVDPFETTAFGYVVFFASLWFAVTGTLALAGYFLRRRINRDADILYQVVVAFRQGVLLSLLLSVTLLLQSFRVLTWWNLSLCVVALTLLEVFFTMHRRHPV